MVNFKKLALTALTALTTLTAVAPKAEAGVQRMTQSNAQQMQACQTLANEFIEWENNNWKANRVGPQPRRYENIVPIPTTMVTESGWPGQIGYACGALRTHWNSNQVIYTQLFTQKDASGVYYDRTVRNGRQEAVAKHIAYVVAYDKEVNRYNAETALHNAEVDRRNACRVTYFGSTYDICTGTVLWRAPRIGVYLNNW